MERTLSLVLDKFGHKSLTLMKGDNDTIDGFTIKFENSEEIREKFKKQINAYLEENKTLIESISNYLGRNYRGSIVILEVNDQNGELNYLKRRVLYKKHVIAFKEMVKDKLTLQGFLRLEKIYVNELGMRKLISPFLEKKIRYSNYRVISQTNLIKREIKKNTSSFFDCLRLISKSYEEERKKRHHLKSIDDIYNEYKDKKQLQKELREEEKIDIGEYIEPNFYKSSTVIDGFTYDQDDMPSLDELQRMLDSDIEGIIPDGLSRK